MCIKCLVHHFKVPSQPIKHGLLYWITLLSSYKNILPLINYHYIQDIQEMGFTDVGEKQNHIL